MTNPCRPPPSTPDGTLHWVSHPTYGYRVWGWETDHWLFYQAVGIHADDVTTGGWAYVGPAEVPSQRAHDRDDRQ
jgi:creatinine amidohydrolase/Fe(II)-dependent formamide hydrolase-like protein